MASSLFPQMPQTQSNPMQMMAQLQQFAGLVRGRGNPQKMVMAYMQQHGITQDQLLQTIQPAKEIARMLGLE